MYVLGTYINPIQFFFRYIKSILHRDVEHSPLMSCIIKKKEQNERELIYTNILKRKSFITKELVVQNWEENPLGCRKSMDFFQTKIHAHDRSSPYMYTRGSHAQIGMVAQ